MANEPGAAVLTIFDQLIDRIKQRSPVRTDGKPLGSMVYSQLVLGMPIWRDDYLRPWTPAGGASGRGKTPPAARRRPTAAPGAKKKCPRSACPLPAPQTPTPPRASPPFRPREPPRPGGE